MKILLFNPGSNRCILCQDQRTGKIVCAHAEVRGRCPCACHSDGIVSLGL